MKCIIAGIPVDISGNVPTQVCELLQPYSDDYADLAKDNGINVNCSVPEKISAHMPIEIYGIKNAGEEYSLTERGFMSQSRYEAKSFASVSYSDDFRSASITLTDVESIGGAPLADRIFVAIGDCMVNCLPAFGAVTFHSSCIRYKNSAILFAAPSGTGKSTQSALWKKYYHSDVEYINDDTPILRLRDGKVNAYGSPWAGTSGINNNISAPVRAVVYVKRSESVSLRRIEWPETVLSPMRSVRMQYFPLQRDRQNELVFAIAAAVPMYELSCPICREAVEIVKRELFD